jgi:hypothetical protein
MAAETKTKSESKIKTELRQYQKKTLEAFEKEDVKLPYELAIQKMRVDDFLRKAKEDQAPIQKIIQTMKRIPKVVYDKDGKATKKEYLEVNSILVSKDWKNNPLRVIDYYDGIYYEPILYTVTKGRNDETGDLILDKEYQGNKQVHDIELTDKNRKQVIQDIINNANGTFIEQVKFYYQVPDSTKGPAFRTNLYTYDQFINSSPEEMENLAWTTVSPLHSNKDRKAYMG